MRSTTRSVALFLPAVLVVASSARAQSIDRAKQLFGEFKFAEAKTEFLAFQKTDSRNAAAEFYLGRIATIDNDGEEAIRRHERAVELEDGSAVYHYWLGSAVRDVTPRVSKIKMPFYARRLKKEWERAVQLDPRHVDARFGLVGFYAMAPGAMGGGLDKARLQAGELAKLDAMRGAMARAMIAEQEKNVAAEEAAYREAIAAAPDSIIAYVSFAEMYSREARAAEAFAALDGYAKRRPDDPWALFYIGRLAATTGQQIDRGEEALKQFLGAPPRDAYATTLGGAHHRLGQIAEKRGDKGAAREHYQAALRINPKSQAAKRSLGNL